MQKDTENKKYKYGTLASSISVPENVLYLPFRILLSFLHPKKNILSCFPRTTWSVPNRVFSDLPLYLFHTVSGG